MPFKSKRRKTTNASDGAGAAPALPKHACAPGMVSLAGVLGGGPLFFERDTLGGQCTVMATDGKALWRHTCPCAMDDEAANAEARTCSRRISQLLGGDGTSGYTGEVTESQTSPETARGPLGLKLMDEGQGGSAGTGDTSLLVLLPASGSNIDTVWQGMQSHTASVLYAEGGLHSEIARLRREQRNLLETHRTLLDASNVKEAHAPDPSECMRRVLIFQALLREKDAKIAELEITPSPRKISSSDTAAAAEAGGKDNAMPSKASGNRTVAQPTWEGADDDDDDDDMEL